MELSLGAKLRNWLEGLNNPRLASTAQTGLCRYRRRLRPPGSPDRAAIRCYLIHADLDHVPAEDLPPQHIWPTQGEYCPPPTAVTYVSLH